MSDGLRVLSLNIESQLSARFTETVVESTVENTASSNMDAFFTVQIPELAFISNFSMVVNDVVFVAEVKEKKQAQAEYEKAKQEGKTAGLVSSAPQSYDVERVYSCGE